MQLLAYRRQFLLTPDPVAAFSRWQQASAGPYALQVHPDCPLTIAAGEGRSAILIGYALDPRQPDATNADLAGRMARCDNVEGFANCLYDLSGRFLALQIGPGMMRIFGDAFGLRSLFWTVRDGRFHAASQPSLLDRAVPLERSDAYEQYMQSEYVRTRPGHYHPAGVSLFKNVRQLVPNHYLEVRFPDKVRRVRFYPSRPLPTLSPEKGLGLYTELLRGSMDAVARRFPLALALSADVDSRVMLAAAGPFLENGLAYSLICRDLTEKSPDIRLPAELASRLGFKHLVIDAREETSPQFRELYNANTDIPHTGHWGPPAAALIAHLPGKYLAVKSDGAEIVRRYNYRYSRHPRTNSHRYFVSMVKGWDKIPFIDKAIAKWFEGVRPAAELTGHRLPDLFYWEHEMGGCIARNQLEWDIAQEVFTPYGNRELLEATLGVDDRLRRLTDNRFFMPAIGRMWPDAMSLPVHPVKDKKHRIRKFFKKLLMKVGLPTSKKGGVDV